MDLECWRSSLFHQSSKFDGKMTSWYHFDCFFLKQRPKGMGDIENFDQLRWEDQEKIKKKIESIDYLLVGPFQIDGTGSQCSWILILGLGGVGAVEVGKKGKGKVSKSTGKAAGGKKLLDFSVQYAKSGRAACRGCLEKILKVCCCTHPFSLILSIFWSPGWNSDIQEKLRRRKCHEIWSPRPMAPC